MKTIPPPCPEPEFGPNYWRSLDQLQNTPQFREWLEKEFPAGITDLPDSVSRRHFVKIMSASFALAGLGATGCRRPVEHIVPFSKAPENYLHGGVQYYATAMPTRSSAIPLLVRSNDGRPTKIEGNPDHPDSNGATDQFAQASILELYDPDRARRYTLNGATAKKAAALDALAQIGTAAQANAGRGLAFLLEQSSSPTRARLQQVIRGKFPQARWFVHEPIDFDTDRQAATRVYGRPVTPYYKIDQANVIVSLDCDFIGSEEDTYLHVRRFAQRRNPEKSAAQPMNRLYSIESLFTLTGANADHRLRLPPSAIPSAVARLAQEILSKKGQPQLAGSIARLAGGISDAKQQQWIAECANDLLATATGRSLVMAGHRQPIEVHLLAHALNGALGNIGQAVVYHSVTESNEGSLPELARALNAGDVETLVSVGGNPAYTAPSELKWAEAQAKAKTVVRVGYYEDESFPTAGWHLPLAHYLESWGDARTADGTLVPIQPLIEPLFGAPQDADNGAVAEIEVLARIAGESIKPYDVVRETFRGIAGNDEEKWKKFLHDGFLVNSAAPLVAVQVNWQNVTQGVSALGPVSAPSKDSLDVVFHRSYSLDDGRFNNNGWLQETPDPISKLTWDNAVLVSPKTAADIGVGEFDEEAKTTQAHRGLFNTQIVKIEVGGRQIQGPVWIQPGLADNTIALALGYGRKKTGRVGRLDETRPAGFDVYPLRTAANLHSVSGAKLSLTSEPAYPLACTQEHGTMGGRPLVREANLSQYSEHPGFAKNMDLDAPEHMEKVEMVADPRHPDGAKLPKTIYKNPTLQGMHQWGMTIDLNACVGCTACVVACQSENNIPIVGKDQVTKGREMAWIRIDRYYAGPDAFDPQIANLPMLCQHCENAPCESVCPVNATVHDDEGLNLMVYNRCVGTRYCSNNCPYKVRRFNYFDYNRRPLNELYRSPFQFNQDGGWELARWFNEPAVGTIPDDQWELVKLAKNPNVSVRMRGVMEKCTFCVQRIEEAKIRQKVKARDSGDVRVPEGTFKTACQQACPAEAITFGDTSDSQSKVSRMKLESRNYSVLGYLDTRARVTYLARIRNPNPKMPDYSKNPWALEEYIHDRHSNPIEDEAHENATEPARAPARGAAGGAE